MDSIQVFEKIIEEYKNKTKKECYKVELVDDEPGILDNKIGGIPYLPIGEAYPTDESGNYMPLLLQINLRDIALKDYPENGILEIYTDAEVDYPCQFAIRYYEENLDYQKELPSIDLSDYIIQKSYKISLEKTESYMPMNDYRYSETISSIASKILNKEIEDESELESLYMNINDLQDDWYDFVDKNIPDIPCTIGGYANFTQDDPRGYSLENKDECIFKLDSNLDFRNIMIGDSGILFVLSSLEDIKNRHFENAIVDWDCY